MKKMTKADELATKALSLGNPYIRQSTKFFIDKSSRYLWNDQIYTKEEIDEAYLNTARKDAIVGYKDRKAGYYDKWYRYNHADEGRAYDLGQQLAMQDENLDGNLTFIPCFN